MNKNTLFLLFGVAAATIVAGGAVWWMQREEAAENQSAARQQSQQATDRTGIIIEDLSTVDLGDIDAEFKAIDAEMNSL